jgi:enolase
MNPQDIRSIHARRVWDSRGRPTVEAELTLADGAVGRAIAPAGASKGTREAHELRDGRAGGHGGLDVLQAVGHVEGEIARALAGTSARDQAALDRRLVELDGTPQ